MDESLSLEIWDRLIRGNPLDGLGLNSVEGRIDLRNLELPDPSVVRKFQFHSIPFAEIQPGAVFRNVKWQNLDFSNSRLQGLRFFDGEIENCRFDNCQIQGLRWWGMKISNTNFTGANLQKSALGGVYEGKRNSYCRVDFTRTDLRQTAYIAASFDHCVFRDAKLEKVNFQTSTFRDCRFEGDVVGVTFYSRGFEGEAYPANEMINVDFRRANLRNVEFRGLTLDRVQLPTDDDHIIIRNYRVALDKAIAALQQRNDMSSRKLKAYLGVYRKWAVPEQVQGVLNLNDLLEIGGTEGMNRARELLQRDV